MVYMTYKIMLDMVLISKVASSKIPYLAYIIQKNVNKYRSSMHWRSIETLQDTEWPYAGKMRVCNCQNQPEEFLRSL
jgi:hypothetical protein